MDFEAILYYTLFLFYIIIGSYFLNRINNSKKKFFSLLFFLSICAIYLGVRVIVSDYVSYNQHYTEIVAHVSSTIEWEYFYEYFYRICSQLGFSFPIVYMLNLLMIFIPIYLYIIKFDKRISDSIVFISISFFILQMINIGSCFRQLIAIGIFIYSLRFVSEKFFLKYLFCILIAYQFHSTAIVLIPCYFVFRYIPFLSVKFQLIILFIALFFGMGIAPSIISKYTPIIAAQTDKDVYVTNGILISAKNSFGIGIYLDMAFSFIVVLFSNKMRIYYKSKYFDKLYMCVWIGFFIYLFYFTLDTDILPIDRMNYLHIIRFLIYGLCLNYLYKVKNVRNQVSFYILLGYLFITYYSHVVMDFYPGFTPLKFIWDK